MSTDYAYVPPTSRYVTAGGVLLLLMGAAVFTFVALHQTLGFVLARIFGAHPARDALFVSYVAFWMGNVLIGAMLVALCAMSFSLIRAAVERQRMGPTIARLAAVFAALALGSLAAEALALAR